jgi:hypothetical protein
MIGVRAVNKRPAPLQSVWRLFLAALRGDGAMAAGSGLTPVLPRDYLKSLAEDIGELDSTKLAEVKRDPRVSTRVFIFTCSSETAACLCSFQT